jgi:hypothetical protein
MKLHIAALVFVCYLVFDALYVTYIRATASKKAALAANVGCVMYLISAFGLTMFQHEYWYAVPILAGSWLGTYLTIKYIDKN